MIAVGLVQLLVLFLFYVNWHLACATLTVFPGMAIWTGIFRYFWAAPTARRAAASPR